MQKQSKRGHNDSGEHKAQIGRLLSALNSEWHLKEDQFLTWRVPRARQLAMVILRLQRLVNDTPKMPLRDMTSTPAARHLFLLNQQLWQYQCFPRIAIDGKGGWGFDWGIKTVRRTLKGEEILRHRLKGEEILRHRPKGEDRDREWTVTDNRPNQELPLIFTAIGLAGRGLIDRLRKCPIDHRWFYARTQESRFCSSKCRDTFHQNDPARKAKRRKWAKENYRSRKELELGSRRAAQRKGRKG